MAEHQGPFRVHKGLFRDYQKRSRKLKARLGKRLELLELATTGDNSLKDIGKQLGMKPSRVMRHLEQILDPKSRLEAVVEKHVDLLGTTERINAVMANPSRTVASAAELTDLLKTAQSHQDFPPDRCTTP